MPVSAAPGEATVNLLIAFLWMCGADVVTEQGEIALNSSATQRALTFLQSIAVERRAYLPQGIYRRQLVGSGASFCVGDAPMALGGSYEWPRIRDEVDWYEEDDATRNLGFGFLPRPEADTRWSDHWVAQAGLSSGSLGIGTWASSCSSSWQSQQWHNDSVKITCRSRLTLM